MTKELEIDPNRLWKRLMQLAEIGATTNGGVNRQALTDGEHAAWRLITGWAAEAGLQSFTDPVANLFLVFPGTQRDLMPILIGSHLDTQPTGGKFDGAFGVVAALEVAATMSQRRVSPRRDVVVVSWMNEEGSRFAPGMMGSEAFGAHRSVEEIRVICDRDGISVGQEIDRIHAAFGAIERRELGFRPMAYIEPHIEQNTVLQSAASIIGCVTGIQGKKTFEITISGTKGHAGTLQMSQRRDAVLAFARFAAAAEQEMLSDNPDVKFTIGQLKVLPNAPSVIPEKVVFRVDLRHPDNDVLGSCAEKLKLLCARCCSPCAISIEELVSAPSNTFDAALQRLISQAAERRGVPFMPVISFAGHDARHLASLCPSAMIFIPCRDGISHDESEWAEPAHVAAGAQILLDVVNRLLAS